MRFKIDENMPEDAARILRGAGHDADTLREEQLVGHSVLTLLQFARQNIGR
jgi:hypothetical protein